MSGFLFSLASFLAEFLHPLCLEAHRRAGTGGGGLEVGCTVISGFLAPGDHDVHSEFNPVIYIAREVILRDYMIKRLPGSSVASKMLSWVIIMRCDTLRCCTSSYVTGEMCQGEGRHPHSGLSLGLVLLLS